MLIPPEDPLQAVSRHGFAVVEQALDTASLAELRVAAARLVNRCRTATHADIRRSPGGDSWGAGSLFAATAFEPVLIEAMCSPMILESTEAILGPARLAVVSFLYEPVHQEWSGPWHRDSDFLTWLLPQQRTALAEGPLCCVQWNVALYPDDCLEVVPGSAGRPDTAAEQAVRAGAGEMPGGVRVELAAGAGVVYTPFLWHRGHYSPRRPRATLHFAFHPRGAAAEQAGLPPAAPVIPPAAAARLSRRARAVLALEES
jgi:ectoine hydroxylase-related dioxygenase (phytanoyl-CoA dioxygenase family)